MDNQFKLIEVSKYPTIETNFDDIRYGIALDKPIGNSNGSHNEIQYFTVSSNLMDILLLMMILLLLMLLLIQHYLVHLNWQR